MKLYCKKCGTKLIEFEDDGFDEETGEKVFSMACPNETCEAHCHFFGHVWRRYGWWHCDVECARCGYRPPDYL